MRLKSPKTESVRETIHRTATVAAAQKFNKWRGKK